MSDHEIEARPAQGDHEIDARRAQGDHEIDARRAQGDHELDALRAQVEALRARVADLERPLEPDALLRSVAEGAPDNIMLVDLEGRIRFINRTVPDLTIDQVLGVPVVDFVPAEFRDAISDCLERVRESGEADRYETTYVSDDGDISYWESRVAPVLRADEVDGFVIHSSNVTERRKAAADRDRFFNLSLDLLCVASTDGHFKRINPAFQRVLGYNDQELLSRPYYDFIHPDDRERSAEAVAGLRQGKDVIDFENRYRRRDGEYRWLSWRATSQPGTGVIYAVARDVTDRRALEEQVRQSQKMDAVGQLAGGIAHDFNNLVLAIQINAEFALDRAKDEQRLAHHLGEVKRATQRAADLTRQLLTFARTQSIDSQELAVDALIDDLLRLLRRLIPENIEVSLSTAPELPTIRGDRTQIEQLVMNLCVNARDAMPDGGSLRIDVATTRLTSEFCAEHQWALPGHYLRIQVDDQGKGIAPEVHKRMFEPFFTTKDRGRGTGLGLATAYAVTKQHGGFIHAENIPEGGARFAVYLPMARDARTGVEGHSTPLGEEPARGRGETILVAEDDEMVRGVVVELLENAGYHVLQAHDGEQAVDLFRKHPHDLDLVLLDIMMPNLGGPQALEQMRALRPSVKAIISTGYGGDDWKLGNAMPETIVLKPYDAAELLHKVRRVIDG